MRTLLCALLAASTAFPVSGARQAAPQTPAPQAVSLRCGLLVVGKTDQLQRDVVITVEGARISGIAAATASQPRATIDLGNQTRLPGLIDTHTHVLALTAAEIQQGGESESVAARTIRGVATARRAL